MGAILTLNAGSSSLKFAVYDGSGKTREADGLVERIGAQARIRAGGGTRPLGATDHAGAVAAILDHIGDRDVAAIGHRVVHGGPMHRTPAVVTPELFAGLQALVPLAPLHQPHNLAAIAAAEARFPGAVQVACFDTAFHRTQPFTAETFALPRRFYAEGVRRYGFHGLSYEFIAGRLAEIAPDLHKGRVVVAHLGNGASLCGLRVGRSVATTMSFTALDGVPMGTRAGQIDAGVLLYLMDQGMDREALTRLLYHESGLLGLSGVSSDMRDLLASPLPEAQEAVDHYTYRIRHEIGALAADLGGLDGLIFCGGIGENAGEIRARVVEGLGWLGVTLDERLNAKEARDPRDIGVGRVRVMVIPTDEEAVIARATARLAG